MEVDSGRELPRSQTRGATLGGPEFLAFDEPGVAVVRLPGRGAVKLRRVGERAAAVAGQQGSEIHVESSADQPGFAQGGPPAELAQAARELYSRMETAEAPINPAIRTTSVTPRRLLLVRQCLLQSQLRRRRRGKHPEADW